METPIATTEFYLSKVSIIHWSKLITLTWVFRYLQVGSYKDLKAREKPIPSLQGNQVLVKIHAVSLNVCFYSDVGFKPSQFAFLFSFVIS